MGLLIISCERPPKHPDTPTIEFRGMDVVSINEGGNIITHVDVKLYFADGTGDLGLVDADSMGLFKQIKESKFINGKQYNKYNRTNQNYWVDVFVKKDGQYVPWRSPGEYHSDFLNFQNKDGRFRPFNNDYTSNKNPIEGFLNYKFEFQRKLADTETIEPELVAGDTIKLNIRILDRKLNISNEITTPEIRVLIMQ